MASQIRKPEDSHHPAWAKAIRDLRLHLKLSQAGLGASTGFSAMTVSRWERGAQEPPSQGYIGLGNLSRNANSWFFWERAGLRSERTVSKAGGNFTRASSSRASGVTWRVPKFGKWFFLKAYANLREPRLIFHRLANREQEDGTLVLRVRQKELSHVVVEKGQPGCTQALGIRG